MKSLNEQQNNNPEIFTPEILDWLKKEGFEHKTNDSYCLGEAGLEHENTCFYKLAGFYSRDWPIRVYIFSTGIGIDVDYECGGNSSTRFYKFEDYTFEQAYDEMVKYVNDTINY